MSFRILDSLPKSTQVARVSSSGFQQLQMESSRQKQGPNKQTSVSIRSVAGYAHQPEHSVANLINIL